MAPVLLGQDARDITRLWQRMFQAVNYHRWAGAEMRAISAGITAMKIWPFGEIALANAGQYITAAEVDRGLGPVRKIRDAVGAGMDIAIQLHAYWNLPSAVAIARALEPYRPMWLEDALPQDNLDAYARLKDETFAAAGPERAFDDAVAVPRGAGTRPRAVCQPRSVSGFMNMMGMVGGLLAPYSIPIMLDAAGGNWDVPILVIAAIYFVGTLAWLGIDPVTPRDGAA